MTTSIEQRRYTLDEYLEMEYHASKRHYFYKGIVAPMTYTSDNHGLIVANLIGELHAAFKGSEYRVYPSDRMLFVPECQLNYYPDVMIVKGQPVFHQHTPKMQATLNPYAIIEVASESTEHYDRVDKWLCYRHISSLRQYLIISQKQYYIDIYNRIDDTNRWENTFVEREEDSVEIAGFPIPLVDIYHLVNFVADPEETGSTDQPS